MDNSETHTFDIFDIYQRFCDIQSRNACLHGEECYIDDQALMGPETSSTRKPLDQLLKFVQSRLHSGISIFKELQRLMSRLELMVDSSDFSRFYDFVFFICRENGQKSITVSRAVTAWRLVLRGWFRQLDSWCDFVEKNHRHNISHDTWSQVMAFSRCVRENLDGYDAEGAWPVLIDEFVEHVYRLSGTSENSNFCNCGDLESQSFDLEDRHPGCQMFPGLKRKVPDDFPDAMEVSPVLCSKKYRFIENEEESRETCSSRHINSLGCSNSPCAVEGCLSKGIAGLFSTRSYLQLNREKGSSFM